MCTKKPKKTLITHISAVNSPQSFIKQQLLLSYQVTALSGTSPQQPYIPKGSQRSQRVCVRESIVPQLLPFASSAVLSPAWFLPSQSSKGKQTKQNLTGSAPRRLEVTQMTQAGSRSTPRSPCRAIQPLPSSSRPAGASPSAPHATGSSLHSVL